MPLRQNILDPRLYETLARFYPSVATIKARATADESAPTSFGEPSGSFVAVRGLEAIQCRLMRNQAMTQERRTPGATITAGAHVVDLAGLYRAIETRMICTIDGRDYDITAVEHDSQGQQTQLMVQEVTV